MAVRRHSTKLFRRVHTRKIDRMVAKHNMEKQGVSVHDTIKHGFFGSNWRRYANAL